MATHGDGLGPLVGCGAKALDLFNLNVLACEFFNFLHKAFLVQGHQTDRFSAGTGAAGSANAVHIVFADIGDFVIHHMRQIVDIDTTRCNVGRHQHTDVAAFKACQRLGTRGLAFVAMQRHGGDALFVQEVGHMVGTKLGAAKHQHLAPLLGLDDVGQQGFLLLPAHGMHHLFDELHRGVFGRDLNALWVVQQLSRQIADLLAEGGREQQALLFFGHQGQHFFHVMDEAHVEHAVGFVQHQHLHGGEVQKTLLLQIKQAPRGGHQNVHAFFQGLDLRGHADTAKDDGRLQLQVLAIGAHRLFHLRGEFSGGREHQGANAKHAKAVGGASAHAEFVQHGQGECRCFAGAGLSACQQVLAR